MYLNWNAQILLKATIYPSYILNKLLDIAALLKDCSCYMYY